MVAFSREDSKQRAVQIKQRRARTQSIQGEKGFKAKHPAWVRDAQAQNPNFTLINKEVKEECQKAQVRNETFIRKLHQDG